MSPHPEHLEDQLVACPALAVAENPTRVITFNETTIAVNLGASPNLPFKGAQVRSHSGEGWVTVEKRLDGLYVDGRKVVLYLSKRQQENDESFTGYDLHDELTGKPVLNSNVLDALYTNTHLIPEEWKRDENGKPCHVFFFGTVYGSSAGNYVRCLRFDNGVWGKYFYWMGLSWPGYRHAAITS